MRLAAIVLAAGKSQRMGRNKLLLDLAGRPILEWSLSALDASALEEVIVVLGHKPDELRHLAEAHGAEVVLNPDYEEGMTSSVKAGLSRVSAEAAFIVLGDQPILEPQLLLRMVKAMEFDLEALVVSPVHLGRRGHPVLLRRVLFPEILSLGAGETLRGVVLGHEANHRMVEGGAWCVIDIDTPEDFERVRGLLEAGPFGPL